MKRILKLLFMLTGVLPAAAQPALDFFRTDVPVTWCGIDYSQVRYFGDPGTVDGGEMKSLFTAINELVVWEMEKYRIADAIRKYQVIHNIAIAGKVNQALDPWKIISGNRDSLQRFTSNRILEMCRQYDFGDSKGFALVMIAESLDKVREEAIVWVVVMRMQDHEVLIAQRMNGKAGGISFRNHWARPVSDVLNKIRSREYGRWKKDIKRKAGTRS